jgi:hypothetical protein
MGSKWFTGGVVAAPRGRIQFDFMFEGIRYRPSIRRPPSEANLRRARERLDEIKSQIELPYRIKRFATPCHMDIGCRERGGPRPQALVACGRSGPLRYSLKEVMPVGTVKLTAEHAAVLEISGLKGRDMGRCGQASR